MNDAMIIGAHSFIYSKDAEADRAFLRDVLGFPHVDAGGGWLIFALPASELAVHPHDRNDGQELYLMCDDAEAFVAEMKSRGIACDPVSEQGWGALTRVTLPSGGRLGVYEPRHVRPAVSAPTKRGVHAKRTPARKRRNTRGPAKQTGRGSAKRRR
jgi:catechol 2,3-dioxygenase-like lactoylglutathione lyase family enzyme